MTTDTRLLTDTCEWIDSYPDFDGTRAWQTCPTAATETRSYVDDGSYGDGLRREVRLCARHAAAHDAQTVQPNVIASDGEDRCGCGCKYWSADECVDCGASVTDALDLDTLMRRATDAALRAAEVGRQAQAARFARLDADGLITRLALGERAVYAGPVEVEVWQGGTVSAVISAPGPIADGTAHPLVVTGPATLSVVR